MRIAIPIVTLAWMVMVACSSEPQTTGAPYTPPISSSASAEPWPQNDPVLVAERAMNVSYQAWLAEPGPACRSDNLVAAQRDWEDALAHVQGGILAGGLADDELILADAAKNRGCTKEARAFYDNVIKIFTGTAYEGQRDRAKIGLDDLQAMKQSET